MSRVRAKYESSKLESVGLIAIASVTKQMMSRERDKFLNSASRFNGPCSLEQSFYGITVYIINYDFSIKFRLPSTCPLSKTMRSLVSLFVTSLFASFLSSFSALDILTTHKLIKDGDKLVSARGTFELGFFSPGNSRNRYLGIWYVASPRTPIWVANREAPIRDGSGILRITKGGILNLINITGNIVWSSNAYATAEDAFAQLLESGNLVVRASNGRTTESYLWQSFDYPCDTYMPGMKIGKNLVTGLETFLTSWKSKDDPAPGKYSIHLDTHGWPQVVIRKGTTIVSRFGSWNGLELTGNPARSEASLVFQFTYSESEVYVGYQLRKSSGLSMLSRDVLHPSGNMQRFVWINRIQNWALSSTSLSNQCQHYAWCGANAVCNNNNFPICGCLTGFSPKSPKDWNNGNWFTGCERRTNLNCHDDGFLRYTGVKLPNTSSSFFSETLNLKECGQLCLSKCSCTAYANLYVDGSGCLLWFVELVDIIQYSERGQDLYVRLAASDIDSVKKMERSNKDKRLVGIIIICGVLVMIIFLFLGHLTYKQSDSRRKREKVHNQDYRCGQRKEEVDWPTFDFQTIVNATANFSSDNKVGEGGFGPVYKGTLIDGQEIAVKRLSINSGQGLNELRNEVNTIAKLQHRNLVKLFGCCLEEEEKMLVYEYVPNKSLDSFIFDQTRRKLLDWPTRMHIIVGIARGLLYLHQDSRMRIIHRDLKASNILLDANMNPKISDFGLAKAFGGDQTEAKTNRIVGTYGYMPPEYAVHGKFSVKSDVFSFGVLALEILSGKKNRDFSDPNHSLNLLGHSWRLWVEQRHLELIDDSLSNASDETEILRCIHIALLCVQQSPEDRPDMLSVVVMLTSDSNLPKPKQPAFYVERNCYNKGFLASNQNTCSENEVTISVVEAR
ncbi:G-type lectin S-receptor-like serine/threonine-protein kinase At4g27290 isoform X2 [Arachis hypogaea]|nr:G-type lectin S-receptor-like serine/threonine-protein kinase At4g27290 isoform X2 [Arachis hypogaea]QHO31649.1 G-type lectin S-receptor-like serine/threonine-protein kinase [Arachis hypogaea]